MPLIFWPVVALMLFVSWISSESETVLPSPSPVSLEIALSDDMTHLSMMHFNPKPRIPTSRRNESLMRRLDSSIDFMHCTKVNLRSFLASLAAQIFDGNLVDSCAS